jgi:hypothetical protein
MSLDAVMTELRALGSPNIARIFQRHGAPPSTLGVKVGDLKPIVKRLKGQHALALELYATGVSDAMYLAGLVADGRQMTPDQLDAWAEAATWSMISEYTVPWVTSDHPAALDRARAWIRSPLPHVATSGWATFTTVVSIRPDAELDVVELAALLDEVGATLHRAPNRVRYTMNGFVIAVGSFVASLTDHARRVGDSLGEVHVDQGGTACEVPSVVDTLDKIAAKGKLGAKRKVARC